MKSCTAIIFGGCAVREVVDVERELEVARRGSLEINEKNKQTTPSKKCTKNNRFQILKEIDDSRDDG